MTIETGTLLYHHSMEPIVYNYSYMTAKSKPLSSWRAVPEPPKFLDPEILKLIDYKITTDGELYYLYLVPNQYTIAKQPRVVLAGYNLDKLVATLGERYASSL